MKNKTYLSSLRVSRGCSYKKNIVRTSGTFLNEINKGKRKIKLTFRLQESPGDVTIKNY
jgi:hypothetical protein